MRICEALLLVGESLHCGHSLTFRLGNRRLGALDVGLCHIELLDRFVEIRLGTDLVCQQTRGPLVGQKSLPCHSLGTGFIGPDPLEGGLRRNPHGFSEFDLGSGLPIIQPGEQLSGLHRVVLVHQDLGQPLLDPRTDGGFDPGLQGPCARHHRNNGPRGGLVPHDPCGGQFHAIGCNANDCGQKDPLARLAESRDGPFA